MRWILHEVRTMRPLARIGRALWMGFCLWSAIAAACTLIAAYVVGAFYASQAIAAALGTNLELGLPIFLAITFMPVAVLYAYCENL